MANAANDKIDLLPMDVRVLCAIAELGGRAHPEAIPSKLFDGDIPAGHPDLVDLGLIFHDGDMVCLTGAGQAFVAAQPVQAGG